MADFNQAFDITMGHEGGYANNKLDTGGETYRGVSRNNWPDWEGWRLIDRLLMGVQSDQIDVVLAKSVALQAMVPKFYKKEFWDVMRLDEVENQAIANELFDTGVNMHWKVAAKFLQEALVLALGPDSLEIDGKIGRKHSHGREQLPRLETDIPDA